MSVGITAMGVAIPSRSIDNATVGRWAATSPDRIAERTGIERRMYARDGVATSDLACMAIRDMADAYPDALSRVGTLIVATSTPDHPQPATAAIVGAAIGLDGVAAFDVQAVCCGFLYALVVGAALVEADPAHTVLVIGADKYSSIIDRADRSTAALFGDGAGAVCLGRVPDGYGLLARDLGSHGGLAHLVRVPAGGTRQPVTADALDGGDTRFHMDGRAVRGYVERELPAAIRRVLDASGVTDAEVSRYVLHQANPVLIHRVTDAMGIDRDRVPITGAYLGNTAAASVPITLHHTHAARPFTRGEHIVLGAVGGGMTVGAAVLRWH